MEQILQWSEKTNNDKLDKIKRLAKESQTMISSNMSSKEVLLVMQALEKIEELSWDIPRRFPEDEF